MGLIHQRATRAPANLIQFASDYPHQHRLQDAVFFRHALGGCAPSTFEAYLAAGRIPPADLRHGKRRAWRETTIAATVEAFAARSRAQ